MIDPKSHLEHTLIPFWSKLADIEHGGFYGHVGFDRKVIKTSDKLLVYSSRMLFAFSLFYRQDKQEQMLTLATHAYEFLNHYIDHDHQGLVWSVDHQGHHKETNKHLYGHVFALYGLSSYALATKSPEVIKKALDLFDLIEKRFREAPMRYYESFDQTWNKMNNTLLDEHGVGACYTTNTMLHLMEAYSLLYEASRSDDVGKRLRELIDGFKDVLYDPDRHGFLIAFDASYNPIDIGQSYGHDIETVWILSKSLERLSIHDVTFTKMLLDVSYHVLDQAMTDHGLITDIIKGQHAMMRIWWVQAEAIVGFLEAYRLSKDKRFMDAAVTLWGFIESHIIDKRKDSEWVWGIDSLMKPIVSRGIAEGWKTPYHNGRALIEMINRGIRP